MRCIAMTLTMLLCACGGDDEPQSDRDGGVTDSGVDIVDAAAPGPDGAGVTAGCGTTPSVTGVAVETVMLDGTERSYTLVVPSGYDPSASHALVFGWHGRGSNSGQARSYFGVEQASAGVAVFVYPQGLGLDNPSDTGWHLTPGGGVDIDLFDYMLAEVSARYCINRDRVFSTGHSYGGFMSNHLACLRSDEIRAIAPVAGGGPYEVCGGAVAAWITHGTGDQVVPLSRGIASRDHWVTANGCGTETTTGSPSLCQSYQGCGDAPVVWCAHDDTSRNGHGWPTFAPESIWRFFAQFQ